MDNPLQSYLEEKLPDYLDLLRQWVALNSFTANAQGVDAVGQITAQAFAELGFQERAVPSTNPAYGKHRVLTHPGHAGRTLGLISHLDTVFTAQEEIDNNFHWRIEGDRIYGPGTNDVKGGTLMILMVMDALRKFDPQTFAAVTWKVLLNAAEETLSDDFGLLCRQELEADGLAALIFEAGVRHANHYQIVTARKGMATYRIQVTGKAAHAGSNHAAGANAIVQLARLVDQVAGLTDYSRDLTFNVGVITGGVVTNRVPHFAEARGEMRTFESAVYDQAIAELLDLSKQVSVISQDHYPCQVQIKIASKTVPWSPNPETEKLFSVWEAAGQSLGWQVQREARGGLSDGNHLWQAIPTLDGLGPHGENGHCSERSTDGSKDQEFASLASFVPKAILNLTALQKLIRG